MQLKNKTRKVTHNSNSQTKYQRFTPTFNTRQLAKVKGFKNLSLLQVLSSFKPDRKTCLTEKQKQTNKANIYSEINKTV